jgi:crotonobetainyl-CoA:carnitine CoA-transferase CaiB-like acyl-CoA transferase
MAKPLDGLRVLDLSHVIAGPLASFYLAQMGAEVIKIESPLGGEVMRAQRDGDATTDTPDGFVALNAGKKSLAIDIRTSGGARIVRELAKTVDVFIENFRPGVVKKYGLDYASIAALKSNIVYCSISGYGQEGEWSGRGAYDHVVQALTGMMLVTGNGEDDPPVKVGFPVIDVAAGMLSALAIVSSIHRRDREGKGQYVDASMAQAALALMYPLTSAALTTGKEPERLGNRGYSGSPTADTYQCTDGWLSTAANTPPQFRKLARILGVEALCSDARALDLDAFNAPNGGFVVARDLEYVRGRIRDAFRLRSAADMETQLNAVGVPAARVRGLGEFLRETVGMDKLTLPVFDFAQDGRTVRTAGLGFRLAEEGGPSARPASSLGADNQEILAKLDSDSRKHALAK